jgi:hypothetical protein
MPGDQDRAKPAAAPTPRHDQDDQLSPARSLRESAGRAGSQRIGNNGPVANPDVSFPEERAPERAEETPTEETGD